MRNVWKRVVFFLMLLGVWELLFLCGIWPEYVLPSPVSVGKTLMHGFQNRTFLIGIGISMKRIAIGYGISIE